MANKLRFNKQQEEWLLQVACKTLTLSEIALELKLSVSTVFNFFKRHNVKCITDRDRIAQKIIAMNEAHELINITDLSLHFNCSEYLIEKILLEHGIKENSIYVPPNKKKKIEEEEFLEELIKTHDSDIQAIKNRRAAYAVYNQTGSDAVDELRKIKTTKRV